MRIFDSVFVIFCATIGVFRVYGLNDFEHDDGDSYKDDEVPTDNYLFVALIDIVFTDGSKRTCTGTVIHDNVVITAAHCFLIDDSTQPELTASFVVIGAKKMFDTGYEQYLPIERVITHPNHRGWTADLALVYTFASMMSDKPGRVVRLVSDKTDIDSEVTVYSWGRWKDEEGLGTLHPKTEMPCSSDENLELGDKQKDSERKHKVTSIIEGNPDMVVTLLSKNTRNVEKKYSDNQNNGVRQRRKKRKHRFSRRLRKKSKQITLASGPLITTEYYRSSLSAEENNPYQHRQQMNGNSSEFNKEYQIRWENQFVSPYKMYGGSAIANKRKHRRQGYKMVSRYRNNWRRKMGDQKNKLTVEVFAFVNTQTCKKLVERTMPSLYEIKNTNEFLCYSSEEHYLTKEDSGAPAMRRGRLVAVTLGGVKFDEERVAVGVKILCFCSWIADNLPNVGTRIQCCKSCCETKVNENL